MAITTHDFPHEGRAQTARWMYWLAQNFANDIGEKAHWPLTDFYSWVRRIPYASDPQAWGDPFREVLGRPAAFPYLYKTQRVKGLDCKKKAIMIGAWAEINGIPWELIAMSEQPDEEIHHVFPVLWLGGRWVNVDATYPHYSLGAPKRQITAAERLSRE